MTVVVGFLPNQYGKAALAEAISEAKLRGRRLVVVNATRGDALVDTHYASEQGIA